MDTNQLPYLIRLLDDTSDIVQERVRAELLAFGDRLEAAYETIQIDLAPEDRLRFRQFVTTHGAEARRESAWKNWPSLPSQADQLETALDLLSQYQYGWMPPVRLKEQLDELSESYAESGYSMDAYGLSRYLFVGQAFRGSTDDYYNPMNNNLSHVIHERRGITISLACTFMLVGARQGIDIWGINTPGHFLAAADVAGTVKIFDCFSHGRTLTPTEEAMLRQSLPPQLSYVLTERASAKQIVSRVLRNLVNAYERAEENDRAQFFMRLFEGLQGAE